MIGSQEIDLRARFPHVDVFARAGEPVPIVETVRKRIADDRMWDPDGFLPASPFVATYVPITQGCDLMCSYCIVPYRRGRQRSHPIPKVVREVETLVARGAREVTLLGQTVDLYGQDLPDKPDLASLLCALNNVPGLLRIRFLTSHPSHMTQRIIHAMGGCDKVCEHICLPMQSGNDEVLSRMRRGYTSYEYLNLVDDIRTVIPDVSLSTDVIVGFPGETEAQFRDTLHLLRQVAFDKVHVACYSPRPGTIAARTMTDDVPWGEKERRRQIVEELQEAIASNGNRSLLGKSVEVLVEERHRGMWQGRARTDRLVFFDAEGRPDIKGQLVQVHVKRVGPWSLQGSASPVAPVATV
jgi:tRNA-2-methylthio-N6-dimethylallyladenosine synthase